MGISNLADVADLVAALGVIGSLVFVGLQIRRNARETRLSNFQAVAIEATNWAKDVAASEELTRLYERGLHAYDDLAAAERGRFNLLMMGILIIIELSFIQHSRRLQSEVKGNPPHRQLSSLIDREGFVTWWQTDRRIELGDEMISRIDEMIAARQAGRG
jgi:hypothetical protein